MNTTNYCIQHDLNYCHKHQYSKAMTQPAYDQYHSDLHLFSANPCNENCNNLTYNGKKIKIFEIQSIK